MSKAIKLFVITLLLCFGFSKTQAQTASINLEILDIGTLDFAAFAFEKNLTNQPRIMQVSIFPTGEMVVVSGSISWKRNDQSGFVDIGSFTTTPFAARTFYNDEIGNSDIEIESSSYNSDLIQENVEKGKPSGVYEINLSLYDAQKHFLNSAPPRRLEFLNPSPPTIILPVDGSSYDVGSIIVQWTPSLGASNYKIVANYLETGQSREEALDSADPLINNKDVGNNITVNFRDVLDRELLSDKNIVLAVKAVVQSSGGEELLSSPIVMFKTNPAGSTSVPQIQTDPKIIQLADFLQGKVQQQFINDLRSGIISADQIQVTDENNSSMTLDSLLELLNMLNANSESLISVQFTAQ